MAGLRLRPASGPGFGLFSYWNEIWTATKLEGDFSNGLCRDMDFNGESIRERKEREIIKRVFWFLVRGSDRSFGGSGMLKGIFRLDCMEIWIF